MKISISRTRCLQGLQSPLGSLIAGGALCIALVPLGGLAQQNAHGGRKSPEKTLHKASAAPIPIARTSIPRPIPIQKLEDGSYKASAPDYVAHINAHGFLASLKVGGDEFLKGPLLYGDSDFRELTPLDWRVVSAKQPEPHTLELELAAPGSGADAKPEVSVTYRALSDALHMLLCRQKGGAGGIGWRVGESVLAVQSQKRPPIGWGRLPGSGLIYVVPVLQPREAIRDMRYYLQNGRDLDAYYILNDAAYNRQSNGLLQADFWGRPEIQQGRTFEFVFEPVSLTNAKSAVSSPRPVPPVDVPRLGRIRGIPYRLVSSAPLGLFAVGSPVRYSLEFAPAATLSGPHTLTWSLSDFWGRDAGKGTLFLPLGAIKANRFDFDVKPHGVGWYRLTVDLRSVNARNTFPSQDGSDLGVFTPRPGLVSTPSPDSNSGLSASIGLYSQRESIYLNQLFPSREKSPVGNPKFDWGDLDNLFNSIGAEGKKWGMTIFCQLNMRPDWADPPNFEALVRAIVARYKDRNRYWEIENEPNERYAPDSYVTLALAPAYRGAHAADPNAVVLGPCIVRVDLNWFGPFFKAGGGKFLDAVSTHTYIGCNRSWEEHGTVESLRQLRDLMDANGLQGKQIWQTEQGWVWDSHAEMPRLHAAYIVRMFALGASVGISNAHNYYFYLRYNGFQPWYLLDDAPKPAALSMRIMAEQTVGMHFDREVSMGKFAHAIVYTDGKEDTAVIWTDDFDANARVRISGKSSKSSPTEPRVFDIMGNPIAVQATNEGTLSLPLSGYPIYLHLPHGTSFEPLDRFPAGTNWARADKGGIATASSYESSPNEAKALNDGTWHFDDGQSAQWIWIAKGPEVPQWAQVTFDKPHRIDTVVAVTASSNGGLPGARNYALQVETNGVWKTVREVKKNTNEWVLYAHFAPVTATRVRVLLTDINNGWWREDKVAHGEKGEGRATDLRPRIYELEAYGHD